MWSEKESLDATYTMPIGARTESQEHKPGKLGGQEKQEMVISIGTQ